MHYAPTDRQAGAERDLFSGTALAVVRRGYLRPCQGLLPTLVSQSIHTSMPGMLAFTPKPLTHALLALLCFHTARLRGRTDDDGALIQVETQDRSKWDEGLTGRGFPFPGKSPDGKRIERVSPGSGYRGIALLGPHLWEDRMDQNHGTLRHAVPVEALADRSLKPVHY
jgi:hypothetical protein